MDDTTLFETKNLFVRPLKLSDKELFYKLMSDPLVMDPIPQPVFNQKESDIKLHELIAAAKGRQKMIWGIFEQGNADLIGICGFLMNSSQNPELAYRFRPTFWGKGYGSDIAFALLNYGFTALKYDLIEADVHKKNTRSIKILQKYMKPLKTDWPKSDPSFDLRYRITKEAFLKFGFCS
ncbi:MAG: GNAT family N-acetyltransferase [Putridiphycobacter sp.]|nr:GNAT family N-acetyltransferase [Putridiphycobacter sp.]